ncbi:MAG: maleylpyruvate isomerase N-terminal domain-containing protein [Actinomycetota bacterium]
MDLAHAYAETKGAFLAAAGPPESPNWSAAVAATPAWTVLDVCRHVTGLAADAAVGRLPDDLNLLEQFRDPEVVRARDEFADGQVARRQDQGPADTIAEWSDAEPGVLQSLSPGAARPLPFGFDVVLVTDLCVHCDDVALALGHDPPGRSSAAGKVALAGYCFGLAYRLEALDLPALILRYDGKERRLGDNAVGASVSADRWELLRVVAGRRSRSQILALDWSGDPQPYLQLLPAYGEREAPLNE